MPDQRSKLILDAEDKTAAAFRSAARNAEMLNRALATGGRNITTELAGTVRIIDVLGGSIGKLVTGVGLAEFSRRLVMNFAELERAGTRAGFGLDLTRAQLVEVRRELEKVSVATNVPLDQLQAAFGKMAASGSRSKDEIVAQMVDIAKAAKVAGIAPAEVAAGIMSLQRQFKFSNAEIVKVLDMMAVKPAGMAALIENAPKLALVMGQIGKGGVAGVREMIGTINFMQKQLGSTEDAATGLVQVLEMMFSDQLTHKLRDAGIFGDLQGRLKQTRAAGGDVLATFVDILEKQGAFDEANENKFENIFGRRIQLNIRALRDALKGVPAELARLDAGAGSVNRHFNSMSKDAIESIESIKTALDQLEGALGELAASAGVPAFIHGLSESLLGIRDIIRIIKGEIPSDAAALVAREKELKELEAKKNPTAKDKADIEATRSAIERLKGNIHAGSPAGQIEALQAQRDKLRAGLDDLGPAAGTTYRTRIETQMKALEDAIRKLTDAMERERGDSDAAKPIAYHPGGGGEVRRVPGFRGGGMYVPGGPSGAAPGLPGPGGGTRRDLSLGGPMGLPGASRGAPGGSPAGDLSGIPGGPGRGPGGLAAPTTEGGSEFLAQKRAGFAEQLKDPATRNFLGAVLSSENPGAGPAVVESLFNRTEYINEQRAKQGKAPLSLMQMMKGGFYGPVNRGQIGGHLRKMNDPAFAARMNKSIDQALGGSNVIQSHTDQGSRGDPNYEKGGVGVNIHGERFNDWGMPGTAAWRQRRQSEIAGAGGGTPSAGVPHLDAFQQYREQLERPIQMKIEAPEVPNQLTPSFRRSSGRNANNREMRDARWQSYSDIGAA